ncbi:MAG: hypothetical protein QXH27_05415 [Candidatus Micrarchaeia archaeon]
MAEPKTVVKTGGSERAQDPQESFSRLKLSPDIPPVSGRFTAELELGMPLWGMSVEGVLSQREKHPQLAAKVEKAIERKKAFDARFEKLIEATAQKAKKALTPDTIAKFKKEVLASSEIKPEDLADDEKVAEMLARTIARMHIRENLKKEVPSPNDIKGWLTWTKEHFGDDIMRLALRVLLPEDLPNLPKGNLDFDDLLLAAPLAAHNALGFIRAYPQDSSKKTDEEELIYRFANLHLCVIAKNLLKQLTEK